MTKIVLLVSLLLVCPSTSFAYLDPGTGSFLAQILIGAILSALFAIKIYWQKIKLFFSKKFLAKTHHQTTANESSKSEDK